MELLTKLECPSCGWRLRVTGLPATSGYFVQRVRCDKDRCRRPRWLVVFHVALWPRLRVQAVSVSADPGQQAPALRRELMEIRTELRRQRSAAESGSRSTASLPPEMTLDEIEVIMAIAEATMDAEAPQVA